MTWNRGLLLDRIRRALIGVDDERADEICRELEKRLPDDGSGRVIRPGQRAGEPLAAGDSAFVRRESNLVFREQRNGQHDMAIGEVALDTTVGDIVPLLIRG